MNKHLLSFTAALIAVLIITVGCEEKAPCELDLNPPVRQTQFRADQDSITQYLSDNGIEAQTHEKGMRYVVHEKGSGSTVYPCSAVIVTFETRLMSSGAIVDSSSTPIGYNLPQMPYAWQFIMPLIKEGGSVTMYAPSDYGYAEYEYPNVPINSNLIIDVELVETYTPRNGSFYANSISEASMPSQSCGKEGYQG